MSDETKAPEKGLWESMMYWKLAVIKCLGKAMVALFASIVATLNGVEWSTFTGTQKFIAIVCGITAMWTVVDAFLNETMSNLKDRHEPPAQKT